MIASRKLLAGFPLLALGVVCSSIGVLTWTFFRPEAILDRSIEAALARSPSLNGARRGPAAEPLADDPNFVLSHLDDFSLGSAQPVRVGDRIEISGGDHRRKTLEVIDVREIDLTPTRVVASTGPRLMMVSCREVGNSSGRLVRFIIEADAFGPVATGRPHHSL